MSGSRGVSRSHRLDDRIVGVGRAGTHAGGVGPDDYGVCTARQAFPLDVPARAPHVIDTSPENSLPD